MAVLLFPEGTQFLMAAGNKEPEQRDLSRTKLLWICRQCPSVFKRTVFSPWKSASTALQFVSIPFFIVVVQIFLGDKAMIAELETKLTMAFSIVLALPIWVLINMMAAPFRVLWDEKQNGFWQAGRYIYNQPQLAFSTEWNPSDNNKRKKFEFAKTMPGALVDYKIEIEGPKERLNCLVFGKFYFSPYEPVLQSTQFALNGRVHLTDDEMLYLACHSLHGTIPAIVRVYILAWETRPDVRFEYTELKSGTRFVLGL